MVLPPDMFESKSVQYILIKIKIFSKFTRLIKFTVSLISVKWNKLPSLEALDNFKLLLDEELTIQDERENLASKHRGSSFNK